MIIYSFPLPFWLLIVRYSGKAVITVLIYLLLLIVKDLRVLFFIVVWPADTYTVYFRYLPRIGYEFSPVTPLSCYDFWFFLFDFSTFSLWHELNSFGPVVFSLSLRTNADFCIAKEGKCRRY